MYKMVRERPLMYRLDPAPVGDAGHGAGEVILLGDVMLRQLRAAHRRHADLCSWINRIAVGLSKETASLCRQPDLADS